MSVTDQDREKAMGLVYDHGPQFPPEEGKGYGDLLTAIAAALAEERQKARAPFLALAEELDGWRENAARYADHSTEESVIREAHARAAAYQRATDGIRRAAEVS